MDVHALPCMLLSGNVLPSAGNSAGCSVMTEVGGLERGGEVQEERDMCIHMADSLHCTAEIKSPILQ